MKFCFFYYQESNIINKNNNKYLNQILKAKCNNKANN